MRKISKVQRSFLPILSIFLLLSACQSDSNPNNNNPPPNNNNQTYKPIVTPVFNSDSAYFYIEKQLSFGPRVPTFTSHKKCLEWLEKQFNSFGAKTTIQKGEMRDYNNKTIQFLM